MAQVLTNTPYDKLQTAILGWRVALAEIVGANDTGLSFIGNTVEPKFELKTEFAEIYDAASGTQQSYRKVPSLVGLGCTFKATEFSPANIKRFFMAGAETQVAANPAATHAPELFLAGRTGDLHGLRKGRQTDVQRTALKVFKVGTPDTELTLDTDYALVTQFGLTFIKMLVDTHAGAIIRVGTGATASTDYGYTELEHVAVPMMTTPERYVRGVLFGPAKTGVNLELEFETAVIAPTSNLDWNSKSFSSMEFRLDLQDNSVNEPNWPFGKLRSYGYKVGGGALI